jgi:hypothetical protein
MVTAIVVFLSKEMIELLPHAAAEIYGPTILFGS